MKKIIVFVLSLLSLSAPLKAQVLKNVNFDYWEQVPLPTSWNLQELTLLDGYIFVLIDNVLYRASENTLEWEKIQTIAPISWMYQGAKFSTTPMGTLGLVTPKGIWKSQDKGRSWLFADLLSVYGDSLTSISNVGDESFYLGTKNGFINQTETDKSIYHSFADDKLQQFDKFEKSPQGILFAKAKHKFFRSSDNGNSWEELNDFILDFITLSDKLVMIIDRNGEMAYSKDGGKSWQKEPNENIGGLYLKKDRYGNLFSSGLVVYRPNKNGNWQQLMLYKPYLDCFDCDNLLRIQDVSANLHNQIYAGVADAGGFGGGIQRYGLVRYKGVLPSSVAAEPESALPTSISLAQNYPNPFNPSTNIQFTLPQAQNITLKVYDILGREVRVLFEGQQVAGVHEVQFDAKDLASGVYVVRLVVGNEVKEQRIILNK